MRVGLPTASMTNNPKSANTQFVDTRPSEMWFPTLLSRNRSALTLPQNRQHFVAILGERLRQVAVAFSVESTVLLPCCHPLSKRWFD